MEPGKSRLLQKHTVDLVKSMNPDLLRPVLFQKHLLTRDESEQLALPGKTTQDKNMFILQQIPTKGTKAFDLFLESLQETADEHPPHAELLDDIMSDSEYFQLTRSSR